MKPPAYWHLTKLDLLSGVDEAELIAALGSEAVTTFRRHPRRKGVVLEDGAGFVYGLSEGLAKLARVSPSGRRVVDALVRPGDLVGRLGDDGPRQTLTLETLTACTVVSIRAEKLRSFLAGRADLMLTAVQILEDRQRRLVRRAESLVFKDVYTRVVETLLQLAVDVPQACPYGLAVDVHVNQSDLADLVGASRQAVNKVLRDLETRDLLHRHGPVYCFQDLKALASLVEATNA